MNGFALKREEYEKGIITALTEIVLKIKNLIVDSATGDASKVCGKWSNVKKVKIKK